MQVGVEWLPFYFCYRGLEGLGVEVGVVVFYFYILEMGVMWEVSKRERGRKSRFKF